MGGTLPEMSLTRPSILVVDDYAAMVKLIRLALQEQGYTHIVGVNDGVSAMNALRRGNYHLVISDLGMPKVDGIELLRTIRSDLKLKHLPFIMVTASSELDRIAAAKQAGVTDYIIKPFEVETLKAKVAAALSKYHVPPAPRWS